MLAFSPLASAPIADNGAGIRLAGIVSGSPVVGISAFGQEHSLSCVDITTGQPELTTATYTSTASSIPAGSILTGSPVVDPTVIVENNILTLADITTGSPELTTSDIVAQTIELTSILTAAPVVTPSVLVEEKSTRAENILTGVPVIGGLNLSFGQGHILVGERLQFSGVDISTGDFTEAETIQAKRITARTPEVQSAVFSHELSFVPTDITSGSAVVSGGVLSEEEALTPTGNITTGNSEVVTGEFIQIHPFSGQDLVTTPAIYITDMTMVETEMLSAASIETGAAVIKVSYMNGSLRRVADVDFDDTSNNVTFSYEYNIAV